MPIPRSRARALWQRCDRPSAAVMVAALLLLGFVGLRVAANIGSVEAFVVAGETRVPVSSGLPRVPGPGYDGEFVWQLSHDPLTHDPHAAGVISDSPPYRQQRIALPAVVWVLHAVTGASQAWLLVAVNLLALLGVALFGALLARELGRHCLWGVVLACSGGVLLGLARDLNEPLSALGLVAGVYLWVTRRPGLSVVPFLLAVLARETALVVLAGLGLWSLWAALRERRFSPLRPALWLLAPLVVEVGWQAHLGSVWGTPPFRANSGNVGSPFGFLGSLLSVGPGAAMQLFRLERLVLLGFLVLLLLRLRHSSVPADVRLGFVMGCLLVFSLAAWKADVQFLRGADEAVLMGLLVAMGLPRRPRLAALAASGVLSLSVAGLYALVA